VRTFKSEPWSAFAEVLRAAGYRACAEDPGPGATIGFDGDGQAIVLKRDARSAADAVDAIRSHMKAG